MLCCFNVYSGLTQSKVVAIVFSICIKMWYKVLIFLTNFDIFDHLKLWYFYRHFRIFGSVSSQFDRQFQAYVEFRFMSGKMFFKFQTTNSKNLKSQFQCLKVIFFFSYFNMLFDWGSQVRWWTMTSTPGCWINVAVHEF